MMAVQKSFLFYLDNKDVLQVLSDEQLGKLLRYLIDFAENGVMQEIADPSICMAYRFMTAQMRRDMEKYERKCQKNAENGKKGGRPSKKTEQPKESEKSERLFEKPKKAYTDTVTDKDKDTDTVTDSVCTHDTSPASHVPTPAAVKAAVLKIGAVWDDAEVERFIEYNTEKGWKVSLPYAVKSWERNRQKYHQSRKRPEEPEMTAREIEEMNEYLSLVNRFRKE